MASSKSPAMGFVLFAIGVLVFTQVVLGNVVSRLRSYAEEDEPDDAGEPGTAFTPKSGNLRRQFVDLLLSQRGDTYKFGGEVRPGDLNPNGYDCSEFIQWAMGRLGFRSYPDGSAAQIAHCRRTTVARAIATRGAFLYRPGHIAVSLGNGRTIEARGTAYGVGTFSAVKGRDWSTGGLTPELFTTFFPGGPRRAAIQHGTTVPSRRAAIQHGVGRRR